MVWNYCVMNINEFRKVPLVGILRGIDSGSLQPLIEACIDAGLKSLEITMNTAGAEVLIQQAVSYANGGLYIGAGTVTTMDALKTALSAGATFIVMPTCHDDIVSYCARNSIPVFPGALTPAEIEHAWNCGASMVKVFPSQVFGPSYFKAVKGPFDSIELLACGGVSEKTIADYFSCGASAAAFGESIFKKEYIKTGDFISIRDGIKALLKNIPK